MEEKNEGMPKEFDFRTALKDPKTGKEIGKNDYASHFFKNKDGGTEQVLERPIGSNHFFHPNGEPYEPSEEFKDKFLKKREEKKQVTAQPPQKEIK